MVPEVRIERTYTAFQTVANPSQLFRQTLVEERRIELRLLGCRPSVLPLSLHPHGCGLESRTPFEGYGPSVAPAYSPAQEFGPHGLT